MLQSGTTAREGSIGVTVHLKTRDDDSTPATATCSAQGEISRLGGADCAHRGQPANWVASLHVSYAQM